MTKQLVLFVTSFIMSSCFVSGMKDEINEDNLETSQYLQYLRMAADSDDTEAQYLLALRLYYGNGIDQNRIEAAKYFKMAANNGNTEAQYCYGIVLIKGQGVPQNIEDGITYCNLARDKGFRPSLQLIRELFHKP